VRRFCSAGVPPVCGGLRSLALNRLLALGQTSHNLRYYLLQTGSCANPEALRSWGRPAYLARKCRYFWDGCAVAGADSAGATAFGAVGVGAAASLALHGNRRDRRLAWWVVATTVRQTCADVNLSSAELRSSW